MLNSLNRRSKIPFSAFFFGSTLLFSMLITAIDLSFSYQSEITHIHQELNQAAQHIEKPLSLSLYSDNQQMTREILKGLTNHPFILKAAFINPKRTLLFHPSNLAKENKKAPELKLPISSFFDNQIKIGELLIFIDEQQIDHQASTVTKKRMMDFLIFSFFITLFSFFIIYKALICPIKKIAANIDGINLDEKKQKLLLKRPTFDPLNTLVNTTNSLLNKAYERIQQEKLQRNQSEKHAEQFRLLFEKACAGIGLLDNNNTLIMANPTLLALIGEDKPLDKKTLKTKGLSTFGHYFAEPNKINACIAQFKKNNDISVFTIDMQLRSKAHTNEHWVHCLLSKIQTNSPSEESLLEILMYDITERAKREQHIIYEAEHDPLTLLLNRRACLNRLEVALQNATKRNCYVAILLVDLDGFKEVNDLYGHEAGDKVIVEIAKRIKAFFRSSDIVARWGGDEFLISFSYDPHYIHAVSEITQDLQKQIATPIFIEKTVSVLIHSSIGISLYPLHDKKVTALIEKADSAMYKVKHQIKNHFRFYTPPV